MMGKLHAETKKDFILYTRKLCIEIKRLSNSFAYTVSIAQLEDLLVYCGRCHRWQLLIVMVETPDLCTMLTGCS